MLTAEEINFLKSTIYQHLDPTKHRAFIFGSRANGTAKKYSDIDIGIEGAPVADAVIGTIQEIFEESDLPYTIDLVDFSRVSPKFKTVAMSDIMYI